MDELIKRVEKIEQRNSKVELDKLWETSTMRKLLIATITYVAITLYFIYIRIDRPFINAVVPTIGFLLSTLSLSTAKALWKNYFGESSLKPKESKKIIATRVMLLKQGDAPEEVEATLNLIKANEESEKADSLRSWVGIMTGVIALIVSILVAIYK